jgi:hypothetical protein
LTPGNLNGIQSLITAAALIPEFCMKINEKLGLGLKDEDHFISLLFTLLEKRRAGGFHLLRY